MTTEREYPSDLARERARFKAGRSSVPPPPRCRSMTSMARRMFSEVAGRDCSDIKEEPPENRSTLNLSVGRRFPIRSLRSFLEISNGKPYIDPETSTIKIYSRGGIWLTLTRFGG